MALPLPAGQLAHLWRPGRHVGRAFTWAVQYRDGSVATEEDYGSPRLVPRYPDNPIVALAAIAVSDPLDQSRHYRLHVPPGAEPIVFWRVARNVETGRAAAMTVLGWRYPGGAAVYLWIYDDGRVSVTDRDLYDL